MIILRQKSYTEITQLPSTPQTLPSQNVIPMTIQNPAQNTIGAKPGILGTIKNGWNNLSTGGKIAIGTTAASLALAAHERRKRKEAEEDLRRRG